LTSAGSTCTIVDVGDVLYRDGGLSLDEDGLAIRHYYFPWAGPKRIPMPTFAASWPGRWADLPAGAADGAHPTRATGFRWTGGAQANTRYWSWISAGV
jgi:hypothetical protein